MHPQTRKNKQASVVKPRPRFWLPHQDRIRFSGFQVSCFDFEAGRNYSRPSRVALDGIMFGVDCGVWTCGWATVVLAFFSCSGLFCIRPQSKPICGLDCRALGTLGLVRKAPKDPKHTSPRLRRMCTKSGFGLGISLPCRSKLYL